jgi:hypothetical protein
MDTTATDTTASDAGTGCIHIGINLWALTPMTTTTHRLRLHHSRFHLSRPERAKWRRSDTASGVTGTRGIATTKR